MTRFAVLRAVGRRGAGAPPAEARLLRVVRAAGRRGVGAPPAEARLLRVVMLAALLVAALFAPAGAQTTPIESELALITPVSKFIHDAALKAFADYAKEKWNVVVKVSAIPAGTPVAYGRIVEWKGRPEVDIFWGGESALFEDLADKKLLQKVEISREAWDAIPAAIGKPKPIPLKHKEGYWVGTALEPYGLVYHPRKIQRLGIPEPREWDDLLNPKLKGEVAQCAPTRSSSSNATYEVILSMHGEDKGWEWLRKLAANTGLFTARSRDVPTVVAKGEFSAGFAVPSYMAFEEKLAGFDLKFVAPKNAFVTPEPMAILAGARNPKAARAFIEFLLSERGQRVFMERGLFPITPKYKVQGAPGSTAEMAVEFTGGVRSYFERDVSNVYDEAVAQKRSEALKKKFQTDIEATWKRP
jgi:ABC-type Fe3+ transport system substrate-binding protein